MADVREALMLLQRPTRGAPPTAPGTSGDGSSEGGIELRLVVDVLDAEELPELRLQLDILETGELPGDIVRNSR